MLMFGWDFKVNALSRFWNWSLIKICDMNSTLWSVVPLAMFYHWHKNTAFTIHCYRGSFYNFCNIGSFKCYNVALAVINEWLSKNKFELFVKGSWRRQWISSTWSPSAHFISPSYSRASRTSRSLARPARWSDWWVVLCLVLIKIIHDWCLTVSYMINDRGQFDHYWHFFCICCLTLEILWDVMYSIADVVRFCNLTFSITFQMIDPDKICYRICWDIFTRVWH